MGKLVLEKAQHPMLCPIEFDQTLESMVANGFQYGQLEVKKIFFFLRASLFGLIFSAKSCDFAHFASISYIVAICGILSEQAGAELCQAS